MAGFPAINTRIMHVRAKIHYRKRFIPSNSLVEERASLSETCRGAPAVPTERWTLSREQTRATESPRARTGGGGCDLIEARGGRKERSGREGEERESI